MQPQLLPPHASRRATDEPQHDCASSHYLIRRSHSFSCFLDLGTPSDQAVVVAKKMSARE